MRKFGHMLWQTAQSWRKDRANTLAAALAFYTTISFAPLLVLVTAIAGFFVGDDTAVSEIATQVETTIGPNAAAIVETAVRNASQLGDSRLSTVLSLGGMLFGATVVFAQLQRSLTIVWEIPREKRTTGIQGILFKRLVSFGMILITGFFLLVSLMISTLLSIISREIIVSLPQTALLMQVFDLAASFLVTMVIFSLIFRYLPDHPVPWRSAWLGGVLTALLFLVGQYVLGVYLARAAPASAYGAAGSLALILLWVYYSAMILLFGAEFTKVYTNEMHPEHTPSTAATAA